MSAELILYLSPSERELNGRLLADLRAAREGRPLAPLVVLVRSNLAGLQLSRRLARETGGYANVLFITFLDLARRLAGPALALPRGAERVIFAALAAEMAPEAYFGPVREKAGLPDILRAAAEDVRQAGLGSWPAELNHGAKLTLFGEMYDAYRALLRDSPRGPFVDEYDLFARAAGRASSFGEIFGAEALYAAGFYDFNEIQRRLLEALAGRTGLTFYMPGGEGPRFRFTRATRAWWEALGGRAVFLPAAGAVPGPKIGDGEAPPTAATVILSAADEEAEAYAIAREALRLGRERGLGLGEAAVLYRGEQTLGVLTEVFERLDLPYYLGGGRPLAATRAGQGLGRLLELASGARGPRPFGRREVLDFVAAAPLAAEADPASWEDITAAAGIVSGAAAWEARLAAYAAACERASPEGRLPAPSRVRALAAFARGLFAELGAFPAEARWRDFASALTRLVTKYFEAAEETEAVLAACEALASYDDVVPRPAPFRLFAATCLRRLEEEKISGGKFEREGLNLIPLDKARGLTFRAVFLPGVAAGVYPGAAPLDPILLDAERAEFNDRAAGRGRFPLRGERLAEEPLLFHLALDAAAEFLVLSYHRSDLAGRERLPSPYLLRVASALAGEAFGAEGFDRAASAYPWFRRLGAAEPPPPEEALDEAEYWAARAADVGPGPVAAYLAAVEEGCAAFREAAASARAGALTPYDGVVASPEGREYLARRYGRGTVAVGASELEALAACPRRYFFERVLKLEAWAEPEEALALSGAARGRIVHDLLREVYRAAAESGSGTAAAAAEIPRLVARALDGFAAEGEPLPRFAGEMERGLLARSLVAFVRSDAARAEGWRPAHFELRFGRRRAEDDDPASTDRPYVLGLAEGESGGGAPAAAEIHGRLDRVDLRDDGAATVLDYKTGRRDRYVAHLAGGRHLQPPLYLMAYEKLFGADPASSRAGYCFPLEGEAKCKFVVEAKRPLDREAVRRLVGGLLALAREGIFLPAREGPGGREPCPYCEFRASCETSGCRLNEAKWASPPAARFRALREIK